MQPSKNVAIVTKSNTFIRAHVRTDSKVFYHILNIVASKIKPGDKDFAEYAIPVRDILKGVPESSIGGRQYRDATEIIRKVMHTEIYLPSDHQLLNVYTLFGKLVLNEKENEISVSIHPDLKPHFLDLKAHFTQLKLRDLLTMSSKYSVRLYEILKSWASVPVYQIELSELHEMLGTPKSMRNDYRQLRTRVLEPTRDEILLKTNFYFEWALVRTGKKVTALKFIFIEPTSEEKEKREKDKIIKLQKESNACFEKHEKKGAACKPQKKSELCQYCQERGRSFGRIFQAQKVAAPAAVSTKSSGFINGGVKLLALAMEI